MVSSLVLLLTTALAGMVSAQASSNITINPNSVNETLKTNWCTAEKNTCRSLCGGPGETASNDCMTSNLNYTCSCTNGTDPDVSQYSESLPAYICREYVIQCVAAVSDGDRDAIYQCRQVEGTCGQLNASDPADGGSNPQASGSDSTPSATASSGDNAPSASNTGAPASATSGGAAAALGASYGTPAIAAGMLALFGLVL
ncbi:hypothetical protein EJ05DRAFT_511943 [Pseudovirgaria hyperparasitica]|uniref:DUF7707 domain-containing protein n=1 Tax=Pseudovirgaria hyperparasitica TaxID=470096 RepID=A0A6A6W4W6_9PEZI|nr:uncharacterized protein EJ05DRAFT_511943 [Pseudovirgaria hyperparasitica]KAF2757219.1 hypothetical protein EJ05DRAFT_511943 [Pseudovirgaria hyperparasitica]